MEDVYELMTVEQVQRALNRSRASVYRYVNTKNNVLNPAYRADRLNPELRSDRDMPLVFHPNEVARFARDILNLKTTIEIRPAVETSTHELLQSILNELKQIRASL